MREDGAAFLSLAGQTLPTPADVPRKGPEREREWCEVVQVCEGLNLEPREYAQTGADDTLPAVKAKAGCRLINSCRQCAESMHQSLRQLTDGVAANASDAETAAQWWSQHSKREMQHRHRTPTCKIQCPPLLDSWRGADEDGRHLRKPYCKCLSAFPRLYQAIPRRRLTRIGNDRHIAVNHSTTFLAAGAPSPASGCVVHCMKPPSARCHPPSQTSHPPARPSCPCRLY